MNKSGSVPESTFTLGSSGIGRGREGNPSVRSGHGPRLHTPDAISRRALGAFSREVSQTAVPPSFSRRSTVSEVWNKLLELFDRIFANRATELTYRVRNAIVDKDVDALVYLLCWHENTALRDELRRHIEKNKGLLRAIQGGKGDQFAVLRMALGMDVVQISSPPVPNLAPAPVTAQRPAASRSAVPPAPARSPVPARSPARRLVVSRLSAPEADRAPLIRTLCEHLGAKLSADPKFLERFRSNVIRTIIEGKDANYRATVLMHMNPNEILFLLRGREPWWAQTEGILTGIDLDQLVPILARMIGHHRLAVVRHLKPNIMEVLRGASPEQREALLKELNGEWRREMEALLPAPPQVPAAAAQSPAPATAAVSSQPISEADRALLINTLCEHLADVLWANQKFLEPFDYNEILQILQDKDANFRVAVLMHMNPDLILPMLRNNPKGKAWALAESILAGIDLDQLVSILARISYDGRLEVVQYLREGEELSEISSEQRGTLLQGLKGNQKSKMEALLRPAAVEQ